MIRNLICFLMLLVTFSCHEKCGEDINMGSFYLTDQTIAEWIPYEYLQELAFVNQLGDTLIFDLVHHQSDLQRIDYRTYCDGNEYDWSDDYATEYFMGEYRSFGYEILVNDINYSISITISVEAFQGVGNPTELVLFDQANLDLQVKRGDDWGEGNSSSCFMNYVADFRGNSFNLSDYSHLQTPRFIHDVTLNGKLFENVLYITNWNNEPTLFLQKEIGVIGFVGLDDHIWAIN